MYESFYNLTAEPFQLNPDPRFYFESESHEKALAYLTYGIRQGEGFVVITGDIGSGKTTLAQKLTTQIDEAKYLAANLVSTRLDPLDLLRMVGAEFGLGWAGESKAELLGKLSSFLRDKLRQDLRPVLSVDEAQNLSIDCLEELRLLSNLHVDYRSALQVIFLGQPQFNETLARPELAQLTERVIASVELGRLSKSDTHGYIAHRLQVAGWKGDPHFSDEALDKIHDLTRGLPRQINKLCARLLLAGFLDQLHAIDEILVDEVFDDFRKEPNSGFNRDRSLDGEGGLAASPNGSSERSLDERITRIEQDLKNQERLLRKALDVFLGHRNSSDVDLHKD